MSIADPKSYLSELVTILNSHWPKNRIVNVACHGHSVPAGYFATPMVDTFNAYPHLLHQSLKSRFPFSALNVIVTAIGGENSEMGAARFQAEVLCHRPDLITIDYSLNDRGMGLDRARAAWSAMIEQSLAQSAKVILLTPTAYVSQVPDDDYNILRGHARQAHELADKYQVGLADSLAAFDTYAGGAGNAIHDLLSWPNHPNRIGHELVCRELMRWFPLAYA